MVHRPAALAPLRNSPEMQILGPHPSSADSESAFSQYPQVIPRPTNYNLGIIAKTALFDPVVTNKLISGLCVSSFPESQFLYLSNLGIVMPASSSLTFGMIKEDNASESTLYDNGLHWWLATAAVPCNHPRSFNKMPGIRLYPQSF